jgi:hypothetical protein
MGSGGARVGAGRKPKQRLEFAVVEGGAVKDDAVPSLPPEDLPLAGREFWQQWAGLAMDAGTLTGRTVPGFRWLCETYAEMRANQQQIEQDGRTYVKVTVDGSGQEHQELKAHPLTNALNKLRKDVEGGMARFCLTAMGKPIAARGKSPAEQRKAALRAQFFGGAARG